MSRYLVLAAMALFLFSPATSVQAVEVMEAVITTAVVDRAPVDTVEVFPVQNGKLYCFTRVTGAVGDTAIYHLWFRNDELMSRVRLPVGSPNWRTWSAKTFLKEWAGDWQVQIQDEDGNLMQKVNFQIR